MIDQPNWDKIKEAVSMAMSADCECDGGPAECVPCRRWRQVQQAIPGLEMMEQERDEARKLAEFWRDEAAAVCDPRDPLGGLHPWEVEG